MAEIDPKLTFLQFNQCINDCDIDKLSRLIAQDYVFIPIIGDAEHGREQAIVSWTSFFATYPDYCNHFQLIASVDDRVSAVGYSSSSDDSLNGPALWVARVTVGRVSQWRIYLDTPENRDIAGLPRRCSAQLSAG